MNAPPARRPGFSLIELMVVISIIGVLSVLGFVGFGAIRRSQDLRNTKATLEIARSMYNSFINAGKSGNNSLTSDDQGKATQFYLKLAPGQWWFNPPDFASRATPARLDVETVRASKPDYVKSIDYYNVPARFPEMPPPNGQPVPMNSPNTVLENRPMLSSITVLDDQALYNDWLPPEPSGTAPASADFADRWPVRNTMLLVRRMRSSPEAKSVWSTLRESQIKHVGYAPAGSKDVGQDFIIDSWGHPILFVPGSGLRGVEYGTGVRGSSTRGGPVAPTSGVTLDLQGVRSPDGRGFWVSAGPDGYYDTQDDNIYSFNN